ncbi:Sin-like protein conserved region-domain-containing protein [Xylogone sp. PMI_703]|nr:Sin-like protein conserved region-domain-containing protein [Xylogone sp. PMI_703]
MGDMQEDQADPDPIKATYDVYIKPHISANRQLFILQFPNRDSKQAYSATFQSKPHKLRIKPKAGMVEMEVPIDAWRNYDREKGIRWGESMRRSQMVKGGGSYGLPGGFGIGGAQPTGRGRGRVEVDDVALQERLLEDYAGAVQREQVLTRQTLGGQMVAADATTPRYMIGAFRNDQLHLVPVDNIVQMRPQFHHLDAQAEQDRLSRPRDPNATNARPSEARAIHMTVKSTVDGEDDTMDNMATRISNTQAESWKRLRFIDENSAEAWEVFHEHLFIGQGNDKEAQEDSLSKVPKLRSGFGDAQYMDAISAPLDAAKLSRSNAERELEDRKGKGIADDEESENTETLPNTPL